jgi:hypothetical protein
MTTVGTYLSVAKDLTRWRKIAAQRPQTASDTKYLAANIGKATSADALMKDRRLFNIAMKAFGLGDMAYASGMMRKVLEQGVDSPKDLANTLNNSNILAFAKAFDYAGKNAPVDTTHFVKSVTDRYVEQAMQADQGAQNPGVQLALYFRERAPQLKTIYGVLADKSLLKVVQTALDIPTASSRQPVDTQARLMKSKVNIDDFKDPKKLDAFIKRFAAMYDMQNPGAGASVDNNANALLYSASFLGSGQAVGVDMSLLLRRQNAARGV